MNGNAPFKQTVVVAEPPVWNRCLAVFGERNIRGRPVIFAWGTCIYNPTNAPICRPLAAHEGVHGMRQIEKADTEAAITEWWERYLTEPEFRIQEELYAHHAEYRAYVRRHGHRPGDLDMIARRLAGPLYGNVVSFEHAKHAVLTGAWQ